MKAVIFPTKLPEVLKPITDFTPEFLIPVVNKPIAEHIIEGLVRNGIKEIIMVLHHLPFETEMYFKAGERWGCKITYTLKKEKNTVFSYLERIQNRLDHSFLVFPGNLITELDINKWQRTYRKKEDGISISLATPLSSEEDLLTKLLAMFEDPVTNGLFPFMMSPEILSNLLMATHNEDIGSVLNKKIKEDESFFYFSNFSCFSKYIDSFESYLSVQNDILKGHVRDILIPGRKIKKGVWTGVRTKIHSLSDIEPPVLIGDHCNISKGVSLLPGTIIGDSVMVDNGASIEDSVILSNTYVGSHTEIKSAVIQKNLMINVPRSLIVYVGDDFILGDMDKHLLNKMIERSVNFTIALLLLFCSIPFFSMLYLYHCLFPKKKFFFKEKRFGSDTVVNLDGKRAPRSVYLYTFKSRYRWIRKLPWLFNVLKGEMNLVGNAPLNQKEVDSLTEEWQTQRFEAPIGIFHLWEAEGQSHPEWDEIIIAENYYAKTRSLGGDLKILLKALLPF